MAAAVVVFTGHCGVSWAATDTATVMVVMATRTLCGEWTQLASKCCRRGHVWMRPVPAVTPPRLLNASTTTLAVAEAVVVRWMCVVMVGGVSC